ncbi:hypothetical protein ACB092_08G192200 [Castanea dentata]
MQFKGVLQSMCFKKIYGRDTLHPWLQWRRCLRIYNQHFLVVHSFFYACFPREKTLLFMVERYYPFPPSQMELSSMLVFYRVYTFQACGGSERFERVGC